MSPGNLYRYFPSKEAMIAGIAERDRAEVAQEFAQRRSLAGLLRRARRHGASSFCRASATSRCKLCTEIMSEARRNPEIARISTAFDADVKQMAGRPVARRRRARRHSRAIGFRRGRHHADDHRRRGVVAPRARSGFQRRKRPCCRSSWTSPATCCAGRARRDRVASRRGESPMKASRITAVGLVAAAGLWIASGYFLPHETAESRAAVARRRGRGQEAVPRRRGRRPGRAAQPQADAVRPHRGRQARHRDGAHRRRADRAAGRRGTWVKKGDIIAVLSDEAREAQVAQAEVAGRPSGAPSSRPNAS